MKSSEVSSKIKGAAKQVGQALRGRTGIMSTLAKEHGMVSGLMNSVLKTGAHDMKERQELFNEIFLELRAHAHAEDRVFYSRVATHRDLADRITSSRKEHQTIENLLDDLARRPIDDATWMTTFKELEKAVTRHVDEEENVIFPAVDDTLDSEELAALDEQYKAAKKAEMH